MKFKFCGNIDCPEWLITEISFLNKINAVKLRIVTTNICTTIISGENKPEKSIKMKKKEKQKIRKTNKKSDSG